MTLPANNSVLSCCVKPEAMQDVKKVSVARAEVHDDLAGATGGIPSQHLRLRAQSAPVSLVLLAIPPSCRCCQWRDKLAASRNGGIHVNKRPPLKFVSKQTLFHKLFLKETLYNKFASKQLLLFSHATSLLFSIKFLGFSF